MDDHWLPKRVLMTLDGPDGATFAVVVTTGGAVGITRDGRPEESCHWPADRMGECLRAFLRLAGRGEGDARR